MWEFIGGLFGVATAVVGFIVAVMKARKELAEVKTAP